MPTATAPPTSDAGAELAAAVGRILQGHREALGVSRRQLALRAGVSSQSLLEVERGIANPTLARVATYAAIYGVDLAIVPTSGPLAAVAARPVPRGQ